VNTRTRLTVITAALAAAVAAGGAAWAATAQSSTESADSTPRVGGHNQSMMDADMPMMGGPSGQAMGEFSADEPFDLQFIDQMTMHHQGALMSTAAMIADSDRPELQQLAAAIEVSQTAQIDQMQTWRTEWYGDAAATAGGMDIARTEQMMSGEAMFGMGDMMGGRGEDMYLQMMIVHHQLGVDMAEEAITRSERPQIRVLAQKIADEQSAQIALMQGYLSEG
jgi:uncharacterized protein (DUF305 family)